MSGSKLTAGQQEEVLRLLPRAQAMARGFSRADDDYESAAMLELVQAVHEFTGAGPLTIDQYVNGRIRNTLIDLHRRKSYERERGLCGRGGSGDYADPHESTAREALTTADAVRQILPEAYRPVVQAYYVERLNHKQTAARLGICPRRVRGLIAEVRQYLRERNNNDVDGRTNPHV